MIIPNWTIPQIWKGETAFVIGGGPSVNTTSLDLIRHRPVIGVNSAFRLGSWVDICFFGDGRWLNHEYKALLEYKGMLVGLYPFNDAYEIEEHDGLDIKLLKRSRRPRGFSRSLESLCWNRSSGGAALDLAKSMGAETIVLIGFDMRRVEGKHNFHDVYDVWYKDVKHRNPHKHHLSAFSYIQRQAKAKGCKVKIVNATPGSMINMFPIMPLSEFLEREADGSA